MTRTRAASTRDQATTAFGGILEKLCRSTRCVAAALVDGQGETVDYAGELAPYDIRITAAELQLVLMLAVNSSVPHWSELRHVRIRADRASYVIARVDHEYAVVLRTPRHSFGVSARALSEAVEELRLEAGFAEPPRRGRASGWVSIGVRTAPNGRRPIAAQVEGQWLAVEVLGRLAARRARPRELVYRARLANGQELTLVREPFGRWYSEKEW